MAFNPLRFSLAVDTIGGQSIRIYFYRSQDAQNVVYGSGYFTDVAKQGVQVNDIIIVSDLLNVGITYNAIVSVISDSGDITVIPSPEVATAEAAALQAQSWAEQPEDQDVINHPGSRSAFNYSAKSNVAAQAAQAAVGVVLAAQTPAFNFSTTTTDADPGAGNVRFNNATLASVTFIYFDNQDNASNDVTGWLNTMANKGIIVVTPVANNGQRLMFQITGGAVDGTGYRKVPVSFLSGSVIPANGAVLAFTFNASGVDGGNIAYYGTKAAANAALAGLPASQVIEVAIDESLGNLVTRYQKVGGVYVFMQFIDSPVLDFMSRPSRSLVYGSDRINQLHLRKALADIVAGTRNSLRILTIGDSLGQTTWSPVNVQIQEEVFLPYMVGSEVVYRPSIGGAMTAQFAAGSSTATRIEKVLPYTYNPIGTTSVHTTGQVSQWSFGNNGIYCDRILIPCIVESGAGTLKIEISENATLSGATYRSPLAGEIISGPALTGSDLIVDCNGASTCNVIQLEFSTMTQRVIRVTGVSGTTRIMDPGTEVKTVTAITGYNMAVGSNGFFRAEPASVAFMAPVIAAFKPDMIIIESDDDLAAYQQFLPILENYIVTAALGYAPYVLLTGNPGIGSGFGVSEAGLKDRITYCSQYARPRGWDVLDGLAFAMGIATLTQEGLQADQVHLTPTVWREMTVWWAKQRGFIRVRSPQPGGDRASVADILAAVSTPRELRVPEAMALLAMPNAVDTGWMGWAAAVSGTGVGAKGNAKLTMNTGFTTTSKVRLYVNDAKPLFGVLGAGVQGVGSRGAIGFMLNVEATGTNCEAYFLGAARTWNSAYAGPLTGEGFGFRLRNNVLDGISWTGGAQVATALSKTLVTGTNARVYFCLMVWERLSGNNTSAKFYVVDNGVATLLDTLTATNTLGHYSAISGEMTNGADAADYKVHFSPPRIAAVGV